jgi:phytoene desaturase
MNCAVIGSGIAGIASAIRLRLKGHEVDVFEANDVPGGKIREFTSQGFRFDMGPTVFTMPHLVNELFELAGKKPKDYFEYEKLDPSFHFFFEDGTHINWSSNLETLSKEIEDKTGEPRKNIERFARDVAEKFDITNEVFIENSLHVLSNYFKKPVLTGMFRLHRVGIISTMNRSNSMFFKDPRVIQLFNHFALYVGSSPLIAPATLNLITHLLMNVGIYIPRNGMYSLVTGLVKLAEEIGVKFHYNRRVDEIVVSNAHVRGIKVNGKMLAFDRVVSNMDVYYTYHKLLPNEKKATRTLSQPKSSSVIGFFWGVNGVHPQLNIHNMLFAKDRNEEYRKVFIDNTVSDDPSTYISVTSKLNPNHAPAGKENWFVLATAPNLQGQDWPTLVDKTRQNLFNKIERMLDIPIRQKIEIERVITPQQIETDYSSAFGAIYGNSSNSRLAAFLRHPNFSRNIKGLFFAGGTVHPGAGIPMCLNSAKIMEKVFE